MRQFFLLMFRFFSRSGSVCCNKGALFIYLFIFSSGNISGQSFLPDSSFGMDGIVKSPLLPYRSVATSIGIQSDGKIIAVGSAENSSATPSTQKLQLIRYHADGRIDSSFGADGIVFTEVAHLDYPSYLIIQPDDKILVGGTTSLLGNPNTPGGWHSMVVRYLPNGMLDSSFADGGIRTIIFPGAIGDGISAIALQPDGKIVVGGSMQDATAAHFALMRLKDNGNIDSSFGTDGVVFTIVEGESSGLSDLMIQPDGKIIAAGVTGTLSLFENTHIKFALARYQSDGSLDNSFGAGGVVATALDPAADNEDIIRKAKLQSDGKIVVAGYSDLLGPPALALARYNTDGSLDVSFGSGGTILDTSARQATGLIIQTNGRILVTWNDYQPNGYSPNIALSVFLADGSKDNSLGPDGNIRFDIGSDEANAMWVIQQSDNKLVIGGSSQDTITGKDCFTLLRLFQDTTTGISGYTDLATPQIYIYPNPVFDYLHIQVEDQVTISHIRLLDREGRTLRRYKKIPEKGIDLSVLASGLYFLQLHTPEGTAVFKISKR